ncbi:competence type IV pilus ATPase ComGA [Salipaludibacillus aurantiacus]|uniref:Competence protein ComGA n=1 Tax=Salipaludibacillus aurantiacus TaxID=1601833 RepID=A0A1H9R603_9BACI|nr:competence type IV pilus ATPase ComGA [Salipaludibacillus aurantiacus]SER68110.1 competence protein ComGA [Salipaludibacillus aurantiacus]
MKMDVITKTKKIVMEGLYCGASDIHLIPQEKGSFVRFRVDGRLIVMERVPQIMMKKLISHLKFISGMDIGERRRPQNKGLEMKLERKTVFMRISTFPSPLSESLVIRLFPQRSAESLNSLSLFPAQSKQLVKLIQNKAGLIIVCGPTGAGKTTTLYSLLKQRKEGRHENIITIEDPVEQREPHFLQMEINERAGITYAAGLKSLLRHDPDLIMLGEVRDSETAEMAVRAALTGHLVVTTLHSASAQGALKRLNDLGISKSDLMEVVHGIAAQRLVDLLCPYCGEDCSLYCRKRRARRRVAVFEILKDEELKKCIYNLDSTNRSQYPAYSLNRGLKKAAALGFIPLKEIERFGKGGW